jgi:hypothetical protein
VTFSDPEQRLDIVAGFVHAGLLAGPKVLCLTEAISADGLTGSSAGATHRSRRPSTLVSWP